MREERVSARALAEFSLLSGDLYSEGDDLDAMREGMLNHKGVQAGYAQDMRAEAPLELRIQTACCELIITGRADGLSTEGGIVHVDEIKSVSRRVAGDGLPVHWGQAEIYAHMACVQHGLPRAAVQLTYVHSLTDMRITRFQREYTAAELAQRFDTLLQPYVRWLEAQQSHRQLRDDTIHASKFPFEDYREGQRKMAVTVYRTLRAGHKLLAQAPTGTGKTMASLYPALRALGDGHVRKVMYLTARRTVRLAAWDALKLLKSRGMRVRAIMLTAKRQICPTPGARCLPQYCPLCAGYYDRRRAALDEASDVFDYDAEYIRALAERHSLCPFELSLDLSEICDIIICDYNYVFDPNVYLRRYFRGQSGFALLIDEAHNLDTRARDMLSAALKFDDYVALFRRVRAALGENSAECRALIEMMSAWRQFGRTCGQAEFDSKRPDALIEACQTFTDKTTPSLSEGVECAADWAEMWFGVMDFVRAGAMYTPDRFSTLYVHHDDAVDVTQLCVEPTWHIRERMGSVRGTIAFSATLSPMSYYFEALSMDEDAGDRMLDLPSPFMSENFLTRCVNIGTRYSERSTSFHQVAYALATLAKAHTGNYLACFPSYNYLRSTARVFREHYPEIEVLEQSPSMDEPEREAFIARLKPAPERSVMAFIVMGGVFAEGIDLPGDRLSGAAIVGVGLPQICPEREALRIHFTEKGSDGFAYAYVIPGICRVLQAAGRVIRTEDDMGVALLLDERFFRPPYPELFPRHWHVIPVELGALHRQLERFWRGL